MGTMWGLARFAALGVGLALAGCYDGGEFAVAERYRGHEADRGHRQLRARCDGAMGGRASAPMLPPRRLSTTRSRPPSDTPEGKAYVRNMLAPRIKAGIEQKMAGQLNGSRPVRLEVVVKRFAIAGAVQRILIGGGRGMVADANLVDARTGARDHRLSGSDGFDTPFQEGLRESRFRPRSIMLPSASPADKVADLIWRELSQLAVAPGLAASVNRFALAIGAWPMLETARIGGDASGSL